MRIQSRSARVAIGLFAASLTAAVFACSAAGVRLATSLERVRAAAGSPPRPIVWSALPSPVVVHPQWTSFTRTPPIRALLERDRLLWAAGDGGVVAWERGAGAAVKFAAEHGLPGNRITSAAATPDGRLWFGSAGYGLGRYDGAAWQIFTQRDGLASDDVRDLEVSRDGLLWVATSGGINRYDGHAWKTFNAFGAPSGLPSDDVRALAVGPRGLWAATGKGVSLFDGNHWTTHTYRDGLANDDVYAVAVSPDGVLWAGTRVGLSRFDGSSWQRFTTRDGLAANEIRAVTVSPDGTVWVGYGTAADGLSRFDGAQWQTFATAGDQPIGPVYAITPASNGGVWVGTAGGAGYFDGSAWRVLSAPDEIPSNDVRGLASARGVLWAASDAGVGRFDGVRWRQFTTADGLASDDVRALAAGPNGEVWAAFGTPGMGLSRLGRGDVWELRPCQTGTPASQNVVAGTLAADGSLWFASERGLSRFDGMTWRTYRTADGLPQDAVQTLAAAPSGEVWAGTSQGLAVFASGQWKKVAEGDVRLLTVSPDGGVWALTANGLTRLDGDRLEPVADAPPGAVRSLLATGDGLWLATSAGVARRDDGGWRTYTVADGLASDDVAALALSPDGTVWAGFANPTLGFRFFDGRRWLPVPEASLPDEHINALLTPPTGDVWMATPGGLTRLDGSGTQQFTTADGLPSNETHTLAYAFDSVWAGTSSGVARFDGRRWLAYGPRSLPTSPVAAFAVAPDGTLWAGFQRLADGIAVFDGAGWRVVRATASGGSRQPALVVRTQGSALGLGGSAHPLSLLDPEAQVRAMAFSTDGRLWVGGQYTRPNGILSGFLSVFDGERWTMVAAPSHNGYSPPIEAIRRAPDGRLWVLSDQLHAVDPDRTPADADPVADPDAAVPVTGGSGAAGLQGFYGVFAFDSDGRAWLAENRSRHVLLFHDQGVTRFESPFGWRTDITSLSVAPDGSVWVGSQTGAAHLSHGEWRVFRTPASAFGSSNGHLQALSVLPGDTVWFSTTAGGAKRYAPGQSPTQDYRTFIPSQEVRAILPSYDGGVWFATIGRGVVRASGKQWDDLQIFAPDSMLTGESVRTLAISRDGSAWIGTGAGVARLTQSECGPVRRIGRHVTALAAAPDPVEGIWLGTQTNGLLRLGLTSLPSGGFGQGWSGRPVTAMAVGPDGGVWFASGRELTRYIHRTWQTIDVPAHALEGEFHALSVAPDLGLWLATSNGVIHFDGRRWVPVTTADGLADNSAHSILATPDGSVWFATPGGLSRYRP